MSHHIAKHDADDPVVAEEKSLGEFCGSPD
jgi:hypothetical protein